MESADVVCTWAVDDRKLRLVDLRSAIRAPELGSLDDTLFLFEKGSLHLMMVFSYRFVVLVSSLFHW